MYTLSSFYKSKEWERLRGLIIHQREKNGVIYDEITGAPIIKAYDIIAHHKEVLTDANVNDPAVALNPDNIILVSHKTHNQIHARFGYEGTRHIYIIYGAPCSGKTSYVESVAGADDLILDIDKLYKAVSVRPLHDKSKRLAKNVFILRDTILDMIKTRAGRFANAYIIGGYPLENERERLAETLGAELIFIERTKEECLVIAETERTAEYKKYIEEWFRDFAIA